MPTEQAISNSAFQAFYGFIETQNKNIFLNPMSRFLG